MPVACISSSPYDERKKTALTIEANSTNWSEKLPTLLGWREWAYIKDISIVEINDNSMTGKGKVGHCQSAGKCKAA